VVVVAVSGAVDMLSAPRLTAAIATAAATAATAATALIVDLSEVEFLACAGMSVLIAAHAGLTPTVQFAVVADGPATRRPLTLVGIDTMVALYRTLDDALRALTDA
jgi:anti-sigma B factor antagonist